MRLQPCCSNELLSLHVKIPVNWQVPAPAPIPAQPLIDSDRLCTSPRPRWLCHPAPPSSVLQAQAVALCAAPAPTVSSPEPVQVSPRHTTCRSAADLANPNAVSRPSSPYYCRELLGYKPPTTPRYPRRSDSARHLGPTLRLPKDKLLSGLADQDGKGILPDQIHRARSGWVSERAWTRNQIGQMDPAVARKVTEER